ncbi:MAG: N-acetylmuramoyl-L-alanine amidase [Thermodesulfobacteriota bacterium]|nr:N-acetylmuramoyl-L-alanine amidase [Thermodesulfobacteriota bacterium]
MNRRHFIKLLSQSAFVSYGLLTCPVLGWSKSAFDLALEGQNLIQQKNFSKAVDVLKKAVSIDPESDWACGLLGRAHLGLGQKAEAVAGFREAVRLNPADIYSRMMIEIITQNPIPKLEKKKKPLTPLEKKALNEEQDILKKLRAEKGLGYKVKRVVIDAGHGGFDPGAVGKSGLKEKEVTLDLAIKLHERLTREGKIKSFLTRTADYYIPLSARTVTANQFQADLFISMHINANKNRQPSGSETYFCSEKASSAEAAKVAALENSVLKYDEPYKKKQGYIDIEEILFKFEQKLNWSESGEFAKTFQERFKKRLPLRSRGVHSANFYVLRRAKMPAILLETGFISNADDEAKLKQPAFREKIVDAVARGLA